MNQPSLEELIAKLKNYHENGYYRRIRTTYDRLSQPEQLALEDELERLSLHHNFFPYFYGKVEEIPPSPVPGVYTAERSNSSYYPSSPKVSQSQMFPTITPSVFPTSQTTTIPLVNPYSFPTVAPSNPSQSFQQPIQIPLPTQNMVNYPQVPPTLVGSSSLPHGSANSPPTQNQPPGNTIPNYENLPEILANLHIRPKPINRIDITKEIYGQDFEPYCRFFFRNNQHLYIQPNMYQKEQVPFFSSWYDHIFGFTPQQGLLIWKHKYDHYDLVSKWITDNKTFLPPEKEACLFLDLLSTVRLVEGERKIIVKERYQNNTVNDKGAIDTINGISFKFGVYPFEQYVKNRPSHKYNRCFYVTPDTPGSIPSGYQGINILKDKVQTSIYDMLNHNSDFWVNDYCFTPYSVKESDPHLSNKDFKVLNMFTGYQAKYMKDWSDERSIHKLKPILDHIFKVWANDMEERNGTILDWLATILQRPRDRITALIFLGEEGCGKSIIAEWLRRFMFGEHISLNVNDTSEITQKFNAHTVDKVFVTVEELKSADSQISRAQAKVQASTMKTNIMGVVKLAQGKFENARQVPNYSFYLMFSNFSNPIYITRGTRRYTIYRCNDLYKGNLVYFTELAKHLNQENANIFYSMLMDREITRDLKNSVETEELLDCIQNCEEPVENFYNELKDGLYDVRKFIAQDMFTVSEKGNDKYYIISNRRLYEIFEKWAEDTNTSVKHLNHKDFMMQMKTAPFMLKIGDNRVMIDGQKTRGTAFLANKLDTFEKTIVNGQETIVRKPWFDPNDPTTFNQRYYLDIKPTNILHQNQQTGGPLQTWLNRGQGVLDQQINGNYNSMNYGLSVQGMNYKSN